MPNVKVPRTSGFWGAFRKGVTVCVNCRTSAEFPSVTRVARVLHRQAPDMDDPRERRWRILGPYVAFVAALGLGWYLILPWWRTRLIPENERAAAGRVKMLTSAQA